MPEKEAINIYKFMDWTRYDYWKDVYRDSEKEYNSVSSEKSILNTIVYPRFQKILQNDFKDPLKVLRFIKNIYSYAYQINQLENKVSEIIENLLEDGVMKDRQIMLLTAENEKLREIKSKYKKLKKQQKLK